MNIAFPINEVAQNNDTKSLALKKPQSIEAEKKRLFKAAKELESLFLNQLLKTMRQTIPKSEMSEGFGLGEGLGKDVYTQMFDQELAMKMSGAGDRSMASQLYKSLERVLEQQFDSERNEKVNLNQTLPQRSYLKIKVENPEGLEKPEKQKAISLSETKQPLSTINVSKGEYDSIIRRVAQKYKLNPLLVASVIKAESNGDPKAVSSAGAKGLMQLIDSTASDMGVQDVFDPRENIEGGVKYLRKMINRFGDIKKALAAYNAGPEAVKRYEGIPPYRETKNYVEKVLKNLRGQKLFD
ncbi:MAG: transglycosylase SLT domain-containing protein [candidate division Zixibacteria bacterium]|nr:transglycosylase SLT domain-containing protein [candidate division Zixibacteria bacterium]